MIGQKDVTSSTREVVSQQVLNVTEKQNHLLDLLLSKKITQERYDEKDKEFETKKFDLELQLKNMKPIDVDVTLELLEKVKKDTCDAPLMFKEGDNEVRENLLKSLLWNLKIKDGEIQSVQYKLPYAYLLNLHGNRNLEDWRREWD